MSEKKTILVISDHPLAPSGVGIQTKNFIETLIKTGKMQKLTKDEFIEEITKNGKKHNYN